MDPGGRDDSFFPGGPDVPVERDSPCGIGRDVRFPPAAPGLTTSIVTPLRPACGRGLCLLTGCGNWSRRALPPYPDRHWQNGRMSRWLGVDAAPRPRLDPTGNQQPQSAPADTAAARRYLVHLQRLAARSSLARDQGDRAERRRSGGPGPSRGAAAALTARGRKLPVSVSSVARIGAWLHLGVVHRLSHNPVDLCDEARIEPDGAGRLLRIVGVRST